MASRKLSCYYNSLVEHLLKNENVSTTGGYKFAVNDETNRNYHNMDTNVIVSTPQIVKIIFAL